MFECSEQLLFSCLCSKLTLTLSHSHSHSFSLSHSFNLLFNHSRQAEQVSMLKSHCLESKIAMLFFDTSSTLSCDIWVHRAGSQLKIDDFYSKSGNFLTWAGDVGVNSMATWPGNSQLAFNLQFDLTTSWQGQHNLQFASCLAGGGGAGACWVGSFECYILRYIERTVHCIEASRFSHNPPLRYR